MEKQSPGFEGKIGAFKMTKMELWGKGDSQLLEI